MLLCSCIAFSAAASYVPPEDPPAAVAAVPSAQVESSSGAGPVKKLPAETSVPETTAEKGYEPAPYILNLAYQYPEGSEESYAEILMKELLQKDSQWYAEIYDMANTAPKKVASRLGKPADSVLGKYNPTSKDQDAKDPSSWSVEHFKNVRVSFYNGDGDVTSAVSNAQDILSLASVYAYYNGITDLDQIRSYINQLWSDSHSYSVSVGDVYYCDGCVNPEEGVEEADSELENEDSFQEGRTIDTEINQTPSKTAGETESGVSGDSSSEDLSSQADSQKDSSETQASPAEQETAPATSAPASETAGSESGTAVAEGASSQENETTKYIPEVTLIEDEGRTVTIITDAETSPEETTEFIWDPETAAPPLIIRLDDETESSKNTDSAESASEDESSAPDSPDVSGEEVSEGETAMTATSSQASEKQTASGGTQPDGSNHTGSGKNGSNGKANASGDGKICPGHVDLKITAKIYTLSEKNNLYSLDKKGNAVEEGSGWDGWTSRTKAFVRHINRQSWADDYDLDVTLPGTRAPLSITEIESYMNQLPSDTTEERKNIIRYALQSVGKVPYYWGGKPESQNYSGNNFGSVTIPDHKGRILRGLDCSGWINWVYWSVTGNRLPYEGTDGLKATGKQIARQDLKPGDIIVITGSTPHVIMFMNWTADGQIRCVHETGSANNVTVGIMTANWPYYRNLLD